MPILETVIVHDQSSDFESLVETITTARQNIGAHFLSIGHALASIKQQKLYEQANFSNFGAFLRDKRIGIAHQDAERFIAISQDPAFERQLNLGLSKMLELMKLPSDQREQLMSQGADIGGQHKDLQEMNLSEIKQVSRELKREGKTQCARCRRWVEHTQELDGQLFGHGAQHGCFDLELEERRALSAGRMPNEQIEQVLASLKTSNNTQQAVSTQQPDSGPEPPAIQWLPERLYQLYGQLLQDQSQGEVTRAGLEQEKETLRKFMHLCQNRLHEINELLQTLTELESE